MYPVYDIGGLVVLVLDIYVLYLIITSRADIAAKLLWVLVVLILPVLGAILYLLLGRGSGRAA